MVKKKFPKKQGVTFSLVHRSQHDPKVVDEDAPQRILVPINLDKRQTKSQERLIREYGDDEEECEDVDDTDAGGQFDDADDEGPRLATNVRPQGVEREEEEDGRSLAYRVKYGLNIDNNDDYDYSKHMKTMGKTKDSVFVGAGGAAGASKDQRTTDIMKQNPEAFASEFEEDVGYLHRDLSAKGIRPDWDPEIVEALELLEDGGEVDEEWAMDDDFMDAAAAEAKDGYAYKAGADPSQRALEAGAQDFFKGTSLEHRGVAGSDDEYDDDDDDARTNKSRFTSYSMTSSVNFRNRGLQGVDEQFEEFYASYDDHNIGELDKDQATVAGGGKTNESIEHLLDGFMEQMVKRSRPEDVPKGILKHTNIQQVLKAEEAEVDDDENEIIDMPLPARAKTDRWDCETIISTYSNLENRPSIIDEPRRKRRQDFVTGLAAGPEDDENKDGSEGESEDDEAGSVAGRIPHARRPKKETKEERRARKNVVKEEKTERRMAKKQTKVLFKEEGSRQDKVRMDRKKNIQGFNLVESM